MKIFVKPERECPNPDQNGETLPSEGAWVDDNEFWQRRLADGDVKATKPPAEPKKGEK